MSSRYKVTKLEHLGLPERVVRALRAGGVETVGELADHTVDDLLDIPDIGRQAIGEIDYALRRHDIEHRAIVGRDYRFRHLSLRARRVVEKLQLKRLEQFQSYDAERLARFTNCGTVTVAEIRSLLARYGLCLKDDVSCRRCREPAMAHP